MKVFETPIGKHNARLTCYVQDHSRELPALESCPAVLILPGGAYSYCSDREGEPVAIAYMQAGFNAFVLRYTTGQDVPMEQVFGNALPEAEEALEYLRAHAGELHIQPDRIAAVGFSAGGHLAAALGTYGRVRPNALVLGYAVASRGLENLHMQADIPLEKIDAATPPAFLFATQGDRLVPAVNSLLFAQRMAEEKIPYELHIFAYGDHGASIGTPVLTRRGEPANTEVSSWLPMSVTFLHHIFAKDVLVPVKQEVLSFGLDMKISRLMSNEASRALIHSFLPELETIYAKGPSCGTISIRSLQTYSNGMFPDEKLIDLEKALAKLNDKK